MEHRIEDSALAESECAQPPAGEEDADFVAAAHDGNPAGIEGDDGRLAAKRPNDRLPSSNPFPDAAPSDADIAVNLGTAHKALGDFARAEAEFRRALQLDAQSARAWNNLGSIELPRGHLETAIEDLTKAVGLDPGSAIYRINLADALNAAA